jgi:hypothetical protein
VTSAARAPDRHPQRHRPPAGGRDGPALQRAGWQSEAESLEQRFLRQALQGIEGTGDIIAGPWTGEVGFELLYWIPFLNWLS